MQYLDGFRLRDAIIIGADIVFRMREHLNKINLFPIPDRDTGTNLTVTFRYVIEQLQKDEHESIGKTSQVIAEGAILAAQGNSGAILAQFFQGLAEGLEGKVKVSTRVFSEAVELAAKKMYQYVNSPVEGTIITVIRDWSGALKNYCQKSPDFNYVFEKSLEIAKQSLAATKDKIDILRRANVVDAGALGFVSLLEGISKVFKEDGVSQLLRSGLSDWQSVPEMLFQDFEAEIIHRYCVECLLKSKSASKAKIQQELAHWGESLAIAHSKRLMKIHLHTNHPETIRKMLQKKGKVQAFRISDLVEQQKTALELQKRIRIGLVTDSSCDLPHELMMKYHVHMVPVRIHFGNETYIDKQTITPLEFYEKLKSSKIHPTTSQPTPANFKIVFERLSQQYETIISINLAGKLSGTFRAAQTAASFIDNAKLLLVDSKTTSIALGLMVVAAGEAILGGLSPEKIVKRIEKIRENLHLVINMPSLKYLMRGGRIGRGKGLLASLLNIKPLLTFDDQGQIGELGKAFGKWGALRKTIKYVETQTATLNNIQMGIVHANAIGKAEWLAQKFSKLPNIKSVIVHDVAPVLGVHAGPGTIGVAFWGK